MKTLDWFKKAVPAPTARQFTVQAGVHLEEVIEMYETLDIEGINMPEEITVLTALDAMRELATSLKSGALRVNTIRNPDKFIDGLGDQQVTLTGLAYMADVPLDKVLAEEIEPSNASKFVNGEAIFNEHGKIKKGPSYKEPNLSRFVPALKARIEKLFGNGTNR